MEQLAKVLAIAGGVDLEERVVERLADLSSSMARAAMECLVLIIRGRSRDAWLSTDWKDAATRIIRSAVEIEDDGAVTEAREAINLLAARGHEEFRRLLGD
jgi:hypothetical protein